MSDYWGLLLVGILLMVRGASTVLTGDAGSYWGVPVPAWAAWIFLPIGIYITFVSFRALRQGYKDKKKK